MKKLVLLFALCSFTAMQGQYNNEISKEFPFGKAHLEAPQQLKDFEPMIGICDCKSESRKPDGTWNEAVDMEWKFKYIMNGWAVQDGTLKADGKHSGSIRQFNQDSLKWYVHYYASNTPVQRLPAWEGTKTDDGDIVLYREQKAPNGMDGFFRLTFYDLSKTGYKWKGEWVNPDETIVYPTWKIDCVKRV